MDEIRKFIPTALVWLLFFVAGITFFSAEINRPDVASTSNSATVTNAKYNEIADIRSIPGAQVIGMVPAALSGEYELEVDGISINENTDISLINLRGVASKTYTLTLYRTNGILSKVQVD